MNTSRLQTQAFPLTQSAQRQTLTSLHVHQKVSVRCQSLTVTTNISGLCFVDVSGLISERWRKFPSSAHQWLDSKSAASFRRHLSLTWWSRDQRWTLRSESGGRWHLLTWHWVCRQPKFPASVTSSLSSIQFFNYFFLDWIHFFLCAYVCLPPLCLTVLLTCKWSYSI